MDPLFFQQVRCPYCGELILLQLDGSAGDQGYVEDCSVCCRPIDVCLSQVAGQWHVTVQRDDD